MSSDAELVDKILSLAPVEIKTIEGRDYSSKQLHALHPPMPATLEVTTLSAIKAFIDGNPDNLERDELILHVESPTRVRLYSALDKSWADRLEFLTASPVMTVFQFGHWFTVEEFIIALQAQFVPDETTGALLKVVGNIQNGLVTNYADDGVTQAVTAKAGITRLESLPIPNPITLRPYRTFSDVEQPSSKFVFRLKSQGPDRMPLCAIFEADGGAWQQEAIKNVEAWLLKAISAPEVNILA